MKKVLELYFTTGEGKRFRLAVDSPKEDLTGPEVESAMSNISAGNIFDVDGGIVGLESAQIITTSTELIEF